MKKKYIFLISIVIFIIDLLIKQVVIKYINSDIHIINNFFALCNVKNTGAAFSILNNNTYLLIIISVIILYLIIKYIMNNNMNIFDSLSLSFILGGLLGNLFDRVIRNEVIDYLSFKIFNYYFPVFNLADIFITVGVILIILNEFWGEYHESESRRRKCKN